MKEQRVILVGCGRKKALCSLCPARHLYLGNVFKARAAYAEADGVPWWIISAKHGLLYVDQMIRPYDVSMESMRPCIRAAWGRAVVSDLVNALRKANVIPTVVEIHAGAKYVSAVRPPAESAGLEITTPLAGLGIGKQLRWYIDHTPTYAKDGGLYS